MQQAEMGLGQDAAVVEVADPVVADNYAKVKVWSAPLCTEFKGGGAARRVGFGHEAAGEVVEVEGVRYNRYVVARHVLVPLKPGPLEIPPIEANRFR